MRSDPLAELSSSELPPVDVFHDGVTHWLGDGFHRFFAYQKRDRAAVPANVRKGTQRDAVLFACGANTAHGLRRTTAYKRNAVRLLLGDDEWNKWSDR